ncbi:hypothetical protein GBA65_03255 [Rubrobacter marinus]|uniref:Uncharacterized protein n=1 Tax=Rubrobacter marinus TaxID=2653852 RepID=A0A6G8PTD3_9ACTN|nr:hypothetical protein [Rubrobacter marinus]QIN77690.1 hypothetical protein GBA65_03255 [Rubrobacter marinus]
MPRGLWPDKPVGSGYTVAVEGGLSFNNISSSPIAEGFINFGWAGIILFAVVFCWTFGILDLTFERVVSRGRDALIGLLYPFMVGFTFFLMRGDLLSSAAFVVGFVIAFLPLALRLPRVRLRAK